MSTIAWDGHTLVADRQATYGEVALTCGGKATKLRKLPNGEVAGIVGTMSMGFALIEWYLAGAEPHLYPLMSSDCQATLIVVGPSGPVRQYELTPHPLTFKESFLAWGSGRDLALGAMAAGADARSAVKIASSLDINTGKGLQSYTLR